MNIPIEGTTTTSGEPQVIPIHYCETVDLRSPDFFDKARKVWNSRKFWMITTAFFLLTTLTYRSWWNNPSEVFTHAAYMTKESRELKVQLNDILNPTNE